MTSNRKYEEILDEDLQNPAEAAQYLSACLESGELGRSSFWLSAMWPGPGVVSPSWPS